jgi:hypothetical protein
MDFSKVKGALEGLTAAPTASGAVTKSMTAADFKAYADEQVAKCEAEVKAGKPEDARKRADALLAEVKKLDGVTFGAGELPAVTVFQDPAQQTPTSATGNPTATLTPAGSNFEAGTAPAPAAPAIAPTATGTPPMVQGGTNQYMAKAAEFGSMLDGLIASLKPVAPTASPETLAEEKLVGKATDSDGWPADLAAPAAAAGGKEETFDWGADPKETAAKPTPATTA